jgi:hypothetical protein
VAEFYRDVADGSVLRPMYRPLGCGAVRDVRARSRAVDFGAALVAGRGMRIRRRFKPERLVAGRAKTARGADGIV